MNLTAFPDGLRVFEDSNANETLKMNWTGLNITKNSVSIQVNFENPYEVSPLNFYDIL